MKKQALTLFLILPLLLIFTASGADRSAQYVIAISVDGLRADVITKLGKKNVPSFYRFIEEGAYTNNARCDADKPRTLPNHISMVTGRPVYGRDGHWWTNNTDVEDHESLHKNHNSYIHSVFDVVHDNGLTTALYTGKSKFQLLRNSYNSSNGAIDKIGVNNGRNKLDKFTYTYNRNPESLEALLIEQLNREMGNSISSDDGNSEELVTYFVNDMKKSPFNFTLFHFADGDKAGHAHGWNIEYGSPYTNAIMKVDRQLKRIFDLIENSKVLKNKTVIILTADHGGYGRDHGDLSKPSVYTIPFYVWGKGIAKGEDLYTMNKYTRKDPGTKNISMYSWNRPIRNSECGNLALSLLGLPAISGSFSNKLQDLNVLHNGILLSKENVEQSVLPNYNTPLIFYSINGKKITPVQTIRKRRTIAKGIYIQSVKKNRKVILYD